MVKSRGFSPFALAGCLALFACGPSPDAQAAIDQQATRAGRPSPGPVATSRRSAIVDAARRVAPAVVSVTVVKRERQVQADPFDFFFVPRGYEREVQGLGTGFIVSPDGVVITNQHVTEGAVQIAVTTPDGNEYPGKLLGEDALTDIAVLKIEAKGLSTAPIGRSDDLMIGEWVVAFGNPYGYLLGNAEPTVTAGVVSAIGRNLYPSGDQPGVYVGMIQTDAAINPGNSGGPLANALGEVVAVNSSIFSNTGSSVGIGFAIPIERAMRVTDELRKYGRVRRAWVGLELSSRDGQDWRKSGGLPIGTVAPGARPPGPTFRRATFWSARKAGGSRTFWTGRPPNSTSASAIPCPSSFVMPARTEGWCSRSRTCRRARRRRWRCWETCRWSR